MKSFKQHLDEAINWIDGAEEDAITAIRNHKYADDAYSFLFSKYWPKEKKWLSKNKDALIKYFKGFGLKESLSEQSYKVGDTIKYTRGNKNFSGEIIKIQKKGKDTRFELDNAGFVYLSDLD